MTDSKYWITPLRRNVVARGLRTGSKVKSKAVGSVPAFVGVIRERHVASKAQANTLAGVYFHVERTRDGTLWHRTPDELTPVTHKGKERTHVTSQADHG